MSKLIPYLSGLGLKLVKLGLIPDSNIPLLENLNNWLEVNYQARIIHNGANFSIRFDDEHRAVEFILKYG